MMINNQKKKALISIRKANSLLKKVESMMLDKQYCIDIMQQNMAVIGLLKSAHQNLMENHLNTCFQNAMASKNEKLKKKMIEEILQVSRLANK